MAQKKAVRKATRKDVTKTAKKPGTRAAAKRAAAGMLAGPEASRKIDARIRELGDWRGKTLEKARKIIRKASPDIVEEWKWMGTPVWSCHGDVCTGETYKSVVKLTFAKGAALRDTSGMFNSSLEGKVRRAVDFREADTIDGAALTDLVRQAIALNLEKKAGK